MLRGTVVERALDSTLVVDVGGVGYVVHVTPRVLAECEPTTAVVLRVHHYIREGQQALYGFLDRAERDAFEVLLGAHGVGPSLAMAVLSTLSPAALADVVSSGDAASLTSVPGIGRKTADRLIVELRDRLVAHTDSTDTGSPGARADVRDALLALGYSLEEIRDAMADVGGEAGLDAEALIRVVLGRLGSRRA
jgi:Holliday junction DNA helicase RuvA